MRKALGVWAKFLGPAERLSKGTRATRKHWPFAPTTVAGTVTRPRPLEICQVAVGGGKGSPACAAAVAAGRPAAAFVTEPNRSKPGSGRPRGGLGRARDGPGPRGQQSAQRGGNPGRVHSTSAVLTNFRQPLPCSRERSSDSRRPNRDSSRASRTAWFPTRQRPRIAESGGHAGGLEKG